LNFFSLFSFDFFAFVSLFALLMSLLAAAAVCCFPSLQHDVFSMFTGCVDCAFAEKTCKAGWIFGIRCRRLHTKDIPEGAGRGERAEFWFCRSRARKQFDEIVMSSLIRRETQTRATFFLLFFALFSGWTWIERRNCRSISIACQCHSTYSPRARPSNTLAGSASKTETKENSIT
jgi:hypothetical protein